MLRLHTPAVHPPWASLMRADCRRFLAGDGVRKYALSRGLSAASSAQDAVCWNVSEDAVNAWSRFRGLLDATNWPAPSKRPRGESRELQSRRGAACHAPHGSSGHRPAPRLPPNGGAQLQPPHHTAPPVAEAPPAANPHHHAVVAPQRAAPHWAAPHRLAEAQGLQGDWQPAEEHAPPLWVHRAASDTPQPSSCAAPHFTAEPDQHSRQGSICELAQLADVVFDGDAAAQEDACEAESAGAGGFLPEDGLLDAVVQQALQPPELVTGHAAPLLTLDLPWASQGSGVGPAEPQPDLPQCDGAAETGALPMLTPVPQAIDGAAGAPLPRPDAAVSMV